MRLACRSLEAHDLQRPCRRRLLQIAACEVANRPGRLEPRVLKRRRHGYKLMQQPRQVLHAKLWADPNDKS
jgi:putative transposase